MSALFSETLHHVISPLDPPVPFPALRPGHALSPPLLHPTIGELHAAAGGTGGWGFIQVLFLLVVYAKVLSWASNLISDGSELLLLVPSLRGECAV